MKSRAAVQLGRAALLAFACLQSTASASSLDDAYRIEIEQLLAEKKALAQALEQAKSTAAVTRRALEGDVEQLTATLTRIRAANTLLNQRLPNTERSRSIADQDRRIDQLRDQIQMWLQTRQIDQQVAHNPPLSPLIARALEHIERHGGLYLEQNHEYFSDNGVATQGTILRIAEVGAVAYGDTPRPLVMVPDGSLRVAPGFQPTSTIAGTDREIGVILFDPREPAGAADYHAESWLDWMSKGGPLMWPIALLGLLSLLLALERCFAHGFAVFRVRSFTRELHSPKQENRTPWKARQDDEDPLLHPMILILSAPFTPASELEDQAAEALVHAQPKLVRGVSFLGIVASVAPLIGLLGTVTGMISTFAVITEHGTGDPRLLSGGISEALLTTQFGLMVAIPALLIHTALHRSAHAVLSRVQRVALALLRARGPYRPMTIENAPTSLAAGKNG